MDPLLLAHPPTSYATMSTSTDDEMAFDSYCIVCDRLIVPPKEVDEVAKPLTKKKMGGGTIRIKNADGTTTTRNANGQKVTRPGLKRTPASAARVAALNATSKMQPLTRSKTSDAIGESPSSDSTPKAEPKAPLPHKIVTSSLTETPFQSSIYCSKACMDQDAGRSSEAYTNLARNMSYDFSHAFALDTPGIVSDHNHGPPSPLFISGSDTESSAASNLGLHDNSGPASSAPKFMEYFRISKEGPDHAWQEIQRQRRGSMQPALHRPSVAEASSDSLSSLWNGDSDSALGRSTSGSGKMRAMTPFHVPDRDSLGHGRRSVSISSEHSAPIPTRQPLRRSELSQSSLAGSPSGAPIPPEFGSAPSHTLDLLHSYCNAFPVRSPSGLSCSSQRGFVFPGSTAMSPAPSEQRRSSISRPTTGTIRAKSRNEATWDKFGKQEVNNMNYRSSHKKVNHELEPMSVPESYPRGRPEYADNTPKQSLERAVGGWKIKYFAPSSSLVERTGAVRERSSSRSQSRSSRASSDSYSTRDASATRGLAIPSAQLSTSNSTATSRTPMTSRMPPPSSVPTRPATSGLPDISGLRLETGGCGMEHAASSVPRTGFNWESSEKNGMRTYELPDAPKSKLDRNKAGLFYFQ